MDHNHSSSQHHRQQQQQTKFLFLKLTNFSTKKQISHALFFFSILFTSIILYRFLIIPFQPQNLLGINFSSRNFSRDHNLAPEVCDYSLGKWVRDERFSGEKYSENCPFLDSGFRCRRNGRRDLEFRKWRWKPHGCDLPRFNASDLLNRSRNGRIVFVGDSIARNQWESLLCMMSLGVANQSTIQEQFGNPISKHKGYLLMKFQEFNLTVEYYRVPFLVPVRRPPKNAPEVVKGVLRLDRLHWYFKKLIGADVIVFSVGHWWNEEKTHKMGIYFQEGDAVNMTMNITEALRRSLNTWAFWVIQNLSLETRVIFRSYAPVHYRNGTWNTGGQCSGYTEPETDYTRLERDPVKNAYALDIVKKMKNMGRDVSFVNITYLSELRHDGHPSTHREPGTPLGAPQDCSHWCLPGVPDSWNEIFYADLLWKGI